jgi:hypothetical protein
MTQDVLKYLQPNAAIPIDMEITSLLVNALKKALSEHAMRETQRLGQEIEQDADSFCDSNCVWTDHHPDCKLAQPEQEPCVHAKTPKGCYRVRCQLGDKCVDDEMSFRTTPPQRKPLTDEEIFALENSIPDEVVSDRDWCIHFARAIEAAHGIKENT